MTKKKLLVLSATLLSVAFYTLHQRGEIGITEADASLSARGESQSAVEWTVSAECLPHSEVRAAESLGIRYAFLSTISGIEVNAFLSLPGFPEVAAVEHRWAVPERGWISSRFTGPPVEIRTYCQNVNGTKELHASYSRQQTMKILTDQAGPLKELGSTTEPPKPLLQVEPSGEYKTDYAAGQGSPNPYSLWFSVPVSAPSHSTTVMRYGFQ